jgi:nitrate reductase alpha subunit
VGRGLRPWNPNISPRRSACPDGLDAVLPAVQGFKESSLEIAREAEAARATDAKAVAAHVAGRLKSKDLELAVGDPDDPEN